MTKSKYPSKHNDHKPMIESIVNTTALALTAYGVTQVTTGKPIGYIGIAVGLAIEWFKYWGRQKELW